MRTTAASREYPARYPRWGYLDKFAMNEHMARAVLAAAVLQGIGLAIYRGWAWMDRAPQATPVATVYQSPIVPLPPGLRPEAHRPTTPRFELPRSRPPRYAAPKIVDQTDWIDVWADQTGSDERLGQGEDSTGVWLPGPNTIVQLQPPQLPSREDFVPVEVRPVLVHMEVPRYPDLAREANVEGRVLVHVLVGRDGFVRDAIVVVSVPMLDDAAVAAARTAVFKPALQSETPVAVWIVIPIEFDLHD